MTWSGGHALLKSPRFPKGPLRVRHTRSSCRGIPSQPSPGVELSPCVELVTHSISFLLLAGRPFVRGRTFPSREPASRQPSPSHVHDLVPVSCPSRRPTRRSCRRGLWIPFGRPRMARVHRSQARLLSLSASALCKPARTWSICVLRTGLTAGSRALAQPLRWGLT